jgi:hypothetical protein
MLSWYKTNNLLQVFTPENQLPYLYPIYITPSTNSTLSPFPVDVQVDVSYQQLFTQYDCASFVAFDATTGALHHTFFGGISLSYVTKYNEIVQDILVCK